MNIYYEFQIKYEDSEYSINEKDICITGSSIKNALNNFYELCKENNMPSNIINNIKNNPQKYLTIIFLNKKNKLASEESNDFLIKKINFIFDDYNIKIMKKNCPNPPDAFTTLVENPKLYKQQCKQYKKDIKVWKNKINVFKKQVGMS